MTEKLRRLTDQGVIEFADFLAELKIDSKTPIPTHLLKDDATSEPVEFDVDIDEKQFNSRHDLGKYLVTLLANTNQARLRADNGLWNWLALFYFAQICGKDKDGNYKPSGAEHYIVASEYGKRPRHAIRTTYILIEKYGDSVQFMFSKIDERGEVLEQIASTQYYWTCKGVINAANQLYQDQNRMTYKSGAAGNGRGSARRFRTYLRQLTLTYDLYTLGSDGLVDMLPKEFARFKT